MSDQKPRAGAAPVKTQDKEIAELKAMVELLTLKMSNQEKTEQGIAPDTADGSAQRFYSGKGAVHHDLFKLEVEEMVKDFSWNAEPDYRRAEHCHFFHTVDSSGKVQIYSTATGGHFHKIKVIEQDGVPKVVCASGPLEWKWIKRGRRRFKRAVPVFEGKFMDWDKDEPNVPVDEHMHETAYLKSDKIALRKINLEATKLIAENAQLTAKPKDLALRAANAKDLAVK